jgi:hypothetical protein
MFFVSVSPDGNGGWVRQENQSTQMLACQDLIAHRELASQSIAV